MHIQHVYDAETQLLKIECGLQVNAVRVYLSGEHYGTYAAAIHRSAWLNDSQLVAVPLPERLFAQKSLEIELTGTGTSIREQVIADTPAESAEPNSRTEPKEDSSKLNTASLGTTMDRHQQLNQWLLGEPTENMDQWVERYTQAADWEVLAARNFEGFVQALFLVVLQRKASADTLKFYVDKFGAQTDAAGAIERITRSDESKAIHAHQRQLNPAIGPLVQQLIGTPAVDEADS